LPISFHAIISPAFLPYIYDVRVNNGNSGSFLLRIIFRMNGTPQLWLPSF
jgi:hypothetical protein